MNVINSFFLKLALLPAGLYRRLGVNTTHLNAILTTKLLMDDRRPSTLLQTQKNKDTKPVNSGTLVTIFMSALIGLFYLFAFAVGKNAVTHLTLYFTFFFFMLAASLISDFTAVLIDVRDNFIILPKPVTGNTVVTARILHISIHICKLVVPMSLPGLVYIVINYNAAGGAYFIVLVFLFTLFVIFFINAVYMLILRLTTPARFQATISYIQIFFAIAIYASYQVLPRLADRFGIFEFDVTAHPKLFIIPMYWFAAGWNTLYTFRAQGLDLLFLLACVVVPLGSLFVVVKYLAPAFNNKMALLASVSAEVPAAAAGKTPTPRGAYSRWASRLCTRPGAERMGFLFTWKMTGRSRDFKLKVYPAIGYMLVFAVLPFLQKNPARMVALARDNERTVLISTMYVTTFLLITAISHMMQSEKYKAAWLYFVAPIGQPGYIISGALKAALVKFYLPVFALVVVGSIAFAGVWVLPNLALGFCNQVIIVSLLVYGNKKVFPFSMPPNNNTKSGNFLRNLVLTVLAGLVGLAHYLVFNIMPVVLIFLALSTVAAWMLVSSLKETPWSKIRSAYADA